MAKRPKKSDLIQLILRKSGNACLFCVLLVASAVSSGCSEEKPKETAAPHAVQKPLYDPVDGRDLRFRIISKERKFRLNAGNPPIRFSLANTGHATIAVPEWRVREECNVELWYASSANGEWKCLFSGKNIASSEPDHELRSELLLAPENAVLAEIPSSHLKKIGKTGKFFLRGRLALESLKLETSPVEINLSF